MKRFGRLSQAGSQKILFAILTVLLFAVFAFQLVYHAVRTSPTVDEPFHILAGHRHWQCGDFGINPEHPPLLKLLATAPLNFRGLSEPPWECGSKFTSKFEGFSYGSTFVVENGVDNTVISTRLAASLMSMLLALLVFLAAWEMFGRWEALTALALVAFEPNLIAHRIDCHDRYGDKCNCLRSRLRTIPVRQGGDMVSFSGCRDRGRVNVGGEAFSGGICWHSVRLATRRYAVFPTGNEARESGPQAHRSFCGYLSDWFGDPLVILRFSLSRHFQQDHPDHIRS